MCDPHWRLQSAHLFSSAIEFSLIGRLEHFSETVAAFFEWIGLENTSPGDVRNASGLSAEYDEETAILVQSLYQTDFEAFGYPYDNWRDQSHGSSRQEPSKVSETRYLGEILERNVVIGELYNRLDRLAIEQKASLERFRGRPFGTLFDDYIANIDGWLDKAEARLLFELAGATRGGCIVEVGAYRGRSTAALALGSIAGEEVPVFSIEPHESFVGPFGGKFGSIDRGHFMRRMIELDLFHIVRLVNLSSEFLAGRWPMPVELLWIDGDHRYDAVARDFVFWKEKLAPNATVVFDDASNPDTGPGRLVREISASGEMEQIARVGKAVHLRIKN